MLKREVHRQALVRAATSGSAKFFLGTDSAPHAAALKEASVCGAGCYTAPAALELYAEAFDAADALDRLEAFASHNGPDFYGLPRNDGASRCAARLGPCPRPYRSATRSSSRCAVGARRLTLADWQRLAARHGLRTSRWNANPASRC